MIETLEALARAALEPMGLAVAFVGDAVVTVSRCDIRIAQARVTKDADTPMRRWTTYRAGFRGWVREHTDVCDAGWPERAVAALVEACR